MRPSFLPKETAKETTGSDLADTRRRGRQAEPHIYSGKKFLMVIFAQLAATVSRNLRLRAYSS